MQNMWYIYVTVTALFYNVKQNHGALYIFKSKLNMENCTVTVHIEEWMHKGFSAALSNGI